MQQSQELQSRIPLSPLALVRFTQDKKRSVASVKLDENNHCVSSHPGKLWICAVYNGPYYRKGTEVAAVHPKKYTINVIDKGGANEHVEYEPRTCSRLSLPVSVSEVREKRSFSRAPLRAASRAPSRVQADNIYIMHPFQKPPPQRYNNRAPCASRVDGSGAGQRRTFLE
ncbi:hypothetical protein MRX96_019143 [Rhipicephalus microplus]